MESSTQHHHLSTDSKPQRQLASLNFMWGTCALHMRNSFYLKKTISYNRVIANRKTSPILSGNSLCYLMKVSVSRIHLSFVPAQHPFSLLGLKLLFLFKESYCPHSPNI